MTTDEMFGALLEFERVSRIPAIEGHALRVLQGLGRAISGDAAELQRVNLTQLGRDLNLQRDVVREALRRLEVNGVLHIETRKEGRPTNFVGLSEQFRAVLRASNRIAKEDQQ